VVLPLYKFYTRNIIPFVGRLVSRDVRAYSYLPESIAAVPQGRNMLALMAEAGFSHTEHHPLTFGVCTIYIARK
jgi:demethylmenaquinone methyltransferase/2-methoxy-6-polyprenyl-1,4-benzoquinol methylase